MKTKKYNIKNGLEILRQPTKENIQVANKYMKRCSPYVLWRKQWNITTNLLGWPKSKILITPNADKYVEQELSFVAGENAKWYSRFGRKSVDFIQN